MKATRYGPQALRAVLAIGLAMISCGLAAALPDGRPPVRSFVVDLDVYPQNFSIAVDDRARVFVGGDGVLIFDGSHWQQVPVSNGDIVRSLARGNEGRVYVGGYDAFGYIEQSPTGQFVYRELSELFEEDLDGSLFADIWRMAVTPSAVYFVGLEHLFRYEPETGRTESWFHDGSFGPIVHYQDRVLLQFRGEGIKEYEGGAWKLVESPDLSRIFLEAAVETGDGALLLISSDRLWYRFDGQRFEELPGSRDLPYKGSVTNALPVGGTSVALTTQLGKVVFVDLDDWSSEVVEVSSGYLADAVRTEGGELLFVDDLGFQALTWPAPWRVVDDGLAGTVHGFTMLAGDAYALTSSGLFLRRAEASSFERQDWTDYEAWALLPLEDGSLLFADSYELLLRKPDGSVEVLDESTTARELVRSERDPDLVWVGTEFGIQVLQRSNGRWRSVYRNDDLDNLRVTDIIETGPDEIWVGAERGGIRRLSFMRGAEWQMTATRFDDSHGLAYGVDDPGAYLHRIDGELHAATGAGLFQWQGQRFVASTLQDLAEVLPAGQSVRIAVDGERQWAFTYGHLFRRPDVQSSTWQEVDVGGLARGALSRIDFVDGKLVLGVLGRLLVFDPANETDLPQQAPLNLTSATVFRGAEDPGGEAVSLDRVELSSGDARLTLRYVLSDLRNPERVQYRTRLLPLEANFSPFSDVSQQSFVGMNPGAYEFEVEARDSLGRLAALSVPIAVTPRWFEQPTLRGLGVLALLLVAVGATLLIGRRRSRMLRRDRDRLEEMVSERTRELAAANQRLDSMAHLDGLTQIPNRRRLDVYLDEVWLQSIERGRALAIALIDVDHFKRYNDSFGHQAGDDLLIALAHLLSTHLRRSEDLVARYGGEEFLVVLPGADLETARGIVEGMRLAVADSGLNVTISAGVHALQPDASGSVAAAITAADTALYDAKSGGRDRVEIASPRN